MIKFSQMLDLIFQNLAADPPSSPLSHKATEGQGRLRRASKKYTSKFFEKILNTAAKNIMRSDLIIFNRIEVSVNLVGKGKIRELNKKYRHKNQVTDVLSFPMSEKGLKKLKAKSYKLEAIDLGDIFICLPFAKKEAKRENIDIDRKLAQLTVHGFLHLIGYDHERSKKDAEKMFDLENKILEASSF